jgi:dihydrofolate reductase
VTRKRSIVVYVAVSADGYIARPDGGVEWLDRPSAAGDYGMRAFLRSIDTILWGRKTYEMALGFGEQGTNFGRPLRNLVFTRGSLDAVAPGFELVREPIGEFTRRLRQEPGRDVWVMGGADLIGSLLDADEVDALVLHVIPTLIGAGIPLLAPRHRLVPLALKSVKSFADGVLRVHYLVERGGAAAGLPAARRRPARRRPRP